MHFKTIKLCKKTCPPPNPFPHAKSEKSWLKMMKYICIYIYIVEKNQKKIKIFFSIFFLFHGQAKNEKEKKGNSSIWSTIILKLRCISLLQHQYNDNPLHPFTQHLQAQLTQLALGWAWDSIAIIAF